MLLDGGPTPGGLESTVLDLTVSPPRLLRPGLIAPAGVEEIIGPISRESYPHTTEPLRSPGLLGRHYAPTTPLECSPDDGWDRVEELCRQGMRVGWLTFAADRADDRPEIVSLVMPANAPAYAAQLYAALHILDQAGVDRIVVALAPKGEDWLAIHDRLRRASVPDR
jgi:L-threonylcarbamoyladenylate synthase